MPKKKVKETPAQTELEFSYELKIPKERVAVLIGKKGETKKQLEDSTNSKIEIDSNEGDVFITGKDALSLFACREVIRAIARGFNPDVAQLLLRQDYGFELIDIVDYAKTKNDELRLKGRVIGESGKSRRLIEDFTETNICVYGKTIGIVGQLEQIPMARRAISALLAGSMHAKVYKMLEREARKLRMQKR